MAILIILFLLVVGFIWIAMTSKANIFRAGIFKNMRSFFSSPKRVGKILMASETGVLSLEQVPMAMGYVSIVAEKVSWLVAHKLKSRIKETGDIVLTVSERSYIPADPFGRFNGDELQPLGQIALMKYREKCARINEQAMKEAQKSLYQIIITFCFCIIILVVVFALFKKHH
jgi:hypothetical protein